MQTRKKAINAKAYYQALTDVDSIGGVMNDEDLEARLMGQQANVENVVPFVISEIVEKEKM